MSLAIKICGITNVDDARMVAAAGADMIGIVMANSPRQVSPEEARTIARSLPASVRSVGVFVNAAPCLIRDMIQVCGFDVVQLQGEEPPAACTGLGVPVLKGIRLTGPVEPANLAAYDVAGFVFDTDVPGLHGGTGSRFDWSWLSGFSDRPFLLAGGLNSENVTSAIASVAPTGVDVSSGVGRDARHKDPIRVTAFIAAARSAMRSSAPTGQPIVFQQMNHSAV